MPINNALLQMSARGAQPRMADAMARGYGQGNAILQAQQAQETRNALAQAAPLLATGGPNAVMNSLAQSGQLEPALGLYNSQQEMEYKRDKLNRPMSKYGQAQWDESRGLAPKGSVQAALNSSKPPLTKIEIDQGKGWNDYTTSRYGDTRAAAQSAQSMNQQLDQFGALMDEGVQTGWAEPWKMKAKKVFGIDLQGVAGQEALASISNRIVGPLVKQLGSNPTDRDLSKGSRVSQQQQVATN